MDSKTYQELIEIIEGQRVINNKLVDLNIELINENAEKENMINELMRQEECLY